MLRRLMIAQLLQNDDGDSDEDGEEDSDELPNTPERCTIS